MRSKNIAQGILALALFWFPVSCSSAQDAVSQSPADDLTRGNYATAIAGFRKLLASNASDHVAQTGLVRALLETGKYAEAEETLKRFLTARAADAELRLLLGEVLATTGRYRDAIVEFERAEKASAEKTSDGSIRLRSQLRRGEMLSTLGQEAEALKLFEAVVEAQDAEDKSTAESLTIAARALTHLERFQEATDFYLDALEADKGFIEAQLGGGELFTSKYNYEDAAEFFRDALLINANSARAHLGIARNRRIEGTEGMRTALTRALEINPALVEAKALSSMLDLEAENYEKASETLNQTLAINPNSLDAHALRAAMFYLQNRPADQAAEEKATLAINPRYAELYETIAHFATNTRRYSEAVTFLRRALELNPRSWSAHLDLGTSLMRTGLTAQGRASIETSFKGDPFNLWAKNTLDLLDAMDEYKETTRGQFLIKTAPKDTDVLASYAGDLLDEVSRTLAAKYKFSPKTPIWVEIFPNHEDFAVRTLGLPGLGALGVCFGQVIAQDSPAARPGGQFNWGSTLWHEYTHVVTLQITDHLIPRWFSEGLSVYEERRARPGWGDDWNLGVLKAFLDGRWFKINDLDNGFLRPKRADDVSLAYFEASQVCEFVGERYGFDAILEMLKRYREHGKTQDILLQVLKLSPADFDREFDTFIRGKVGKYLKTVEVSTKPAGTTRLAKEALVAAAVANQDDFSLSFRAGVQLHTDGEDDKAIVHFKRSIELFPFQTGPGTSYEVLADIYEKRGDKTAVAEILDALIKFDENNYPALKRLALLKLEMKDTARALELMRQSFFVTPYEYSMHALAGNAHLELKQPELAIREFGVALGLNPPNMAEAYYNLASAQLAASKTSEARRSILRSLEIAPGYEKAQELLLRIARP
ncbi:MAG: tetratricopeptide repeat protein [Acidobacteriota bacterium]